MHCVKPDFDVVSIRPEEPLRKAVRAVRRHRLLSILLGVIALAAFYSIWVVAQAYMETPAIIARATAPDKTPLRLEDFPPDYLDALLKVEDPSFYSHHGVDLMTPGAGYTTITQALVKQLYFEHFKPGFAKLKQSLIALVLDRRVDKSTQLRIFVNLVYMGGLGSVDIHGFSDAARFYYGKEFKEMSRDEYLALVAMIIGPDGFSVKEHPEKNAERVRRIKRLLDGQCSPAGNSDVYLEACK